jgi:hypothetical protein
MKNILSLEEFINESVSKQELEKFRAPLKTLKFSDLTALNVNDLWVPSTDAADSTTNVKLEVWFERWVKEFTHKFGNEGTLKVDLSTPKYNALKFNVIGNNKYDAFYEKYMHTKGSWMTIQNGYKGD